MKQYTNVRGHLRRKKSKKKLIGYDYYGKFLPKGWEDKLEIEYDPYGEYKVYIDGKLIDSWDPYAIIGQFQDEYNYDYSDVEMDDYSIVLYDENGEVVDEIYVEEFIRCEINKHLKPIYQ